MLPTQFIPEYYRDSKDIVWADAESEGSEAMHARTRRSPLRAIVRFLKRSRGATQEDAQQPVGKLAHR